MMDSVDEQWDLGSLKGDDSNAFLLLGKKKSKSKVKKQDCLPKTVPLSKSQKRKLKKLEEEKVKEALLAESIRTLQKYKIQDDAYSLLRSSGSIGQAETMREKRERAAQFTKVGLVVPLDDRPSKKRRGESDLCQTEPEIVESRKLESCPDHVPQSVLVLRDHNDCSFLDVNAERCSNVPDKDGESDSALPCEKVSSMQHDQKNLSLVRCNYKRNGSIEPEDMEVARREVECNDSIPHGVGAAQRPLNAPTVVHVSRPIDIEEKRKDLPIVMMEQEIMEAINEHPTVIICGETGCGKTTQVPQFLYEAGFGSSKTSAKSGIIGVTQPRRVAVLATAKRVAFEMGFRLGREVGFQVRYDKRIGDSCSIKVMTDGILLREVQSDFLLKRYSVIILDEAHERSSNTDILIGMLSRVIQIRQRLYQEQQEKILSGVNISPENMISQLKLVIMSATLRVDDFVSQRKLFIEPPPVIEVPARQYPVAIHFSRTTAEKDYVEKAYKRVMAIHKRLPPGGILVFVTGKKEIEYLCKKLRKTSRELTYIHFKRDSEKKVSVNSETNSPELEVDMKDISEAFEGHGKSSHPQTDRFNAFEEDSDDPDAEDSYTSDASETESETTIDDHGEDDFEGPLDHKSAENDGNLADALEGGSLSALKAAFDALAGKNPLQSESEDDNLPDTAATEECSKQSPCISENKGRGPTDACPGGLHVLPLYAMLPAAEQLRVFDKVKDGERLIVVATNVAETSLTIPGITYVVDTGREKVKVYNPTNGMEKFQVQWISKASAAQRAGRSGRTGPGHCYRLYSSAAFTNCFPDFSSAEISKIPVDGLVLQMKSMGIDKVSNFPFPTPPEPSALMEAECCLKTLEALDNLGRLSPLGRRMAQFPMSPRHSRMLLTVIQILRNRTSYPRANLIFGYAVAAAAALSLQNPFVIQFEENSTNQEKSETLDTKRQEKQKQKKLKEVVKVAFAKFRNPTSDALSIAYALQLFELSDSPVQFCSENMLHLKTMEEMSSLRKQLLHLVFRDSQEDFSYAHGTVEDIERAWGVYADKNPLSSYEEEILGQAICAGWADRVAKRNRVSSKSSEGDRKASAIRYQACLVKESVFIHRWSSVSRSSPEFVVYTELVETKRPYMHGITSVKADWLVKYAGSLCTLTPLDDPKPYYEPFTDQVFRWVTPTFGPHLWEFPLHGVPVEGDFRVDVFAYTLLQGDVLPCLKSVQKFLAAPPGSILTPEARGQLRIGDLLSKLKTRRKKIDSRVMLKETWKENPQELYSEIRSWFQKKFYDQFEEVWKQMHREVMLDPQQLYSKKKTRLKGY